MADNRPRHITNKEKSIVAMIHNRSDAKRIAASPISISETTGTALHINHEGTAVPRTIPELIAKNNKHNGGRPKPLYKQKRMRKIYPYAVNRRGGPPRLSGGKG